MKDGGLNLLEMSDQDMAGFILEDLDYEKQFVAISGLLQRADAADKDVEANIRQVDEYRAKSSGWRSERPQDEFGELFYASIYQSAAYSMAALGMIAPLFESMFFQALRGIRAKYYAAGAAPAGDRNAITDAEDFWDCHKYYDRRLEDVKTNLVLGIRQLAAAVGLAPYLPVELDKTLEVLFAYRNQMFHNGLEWPERSRIEFVNRI